MGSKKAPAPTLAGKDEGAPGSAYKFIFMCEHCLMGFEKAVELFHHKNKVHAPAVSKSMSVDENQNNLTDVSSTIKTNSNGPPTNIQTQVQVQKKPIAASDFQNKANAGKAKTESKGSRSLELADSGPVPATTAAPKKVPKRKSGSGTQITVATATGTPPKAVKAFRLRIKPSGPPKKSLSDVGLNAKSPTSTPIAPKKAALKDVSGGTKETAIRNNTAVKIKIAVKKPPSKVNLQAGPNSKPSQQEAATKEMPQKKRSSHQDPKSQTPVYLCKVCSKEFSTKKGCLIHEKSVHKTGFSSKKAQVSVNTNTNMVKDSKDKVSNKRKLVVAKDPVQKIKRQSAVAFEQTAASTNADSVTIVETFPCKVCQQSFNCKANRFRHEKKAHSGTNLVNCGNCCIAFTKTALVFHRKECTALSVKSSTPKEASGKSEQNSSDLFEPFMDTGMAIVTTATGPKHSGNVKTAEENSSRSDSTETCFSESQLPSPSQSNNPLQIFSSSISKIQLLFKCTFCPRQFTSVESRKVHEKSHTQSNFYTCVFCHSNFVTSIGLQSHLNKHHRNASSNNGK